MPPLKLLLALAAAAGLAAQGSARSEEKTQGQVISSLIDKVLADPADAQARARLRKAAELASRKEKRAMASEKAKLVSGAEKDREKVLEMRAAREKRLRAWRRDLDRVCSLASSPDYVREAVSAYEALLERAPVYSDSKEELSAASERVKKIFYKTIKSEYPHLVQGREKIDERDIASLLFSRASTQDDYGRYTDTGSTQEVLTKADNFRRLEKELPLQHSNLVKGLNLYSRRNYAEALALFDEVLAFDQGNEEALFYWALAGGNEPAAADEAEK